MSERAGSDEKHEKSGEFMQAVALTELAREMLGRNVEYEEKTAHFPYSARLVDAEIERLAAEKEIIYQGADTAAEELGELPGAGVPRIRLMLRELPLHLFGHEFLRTHQTASGMPAQEFDLNQSQVDRLLASSKGRKLVDRAAKETLLEAQKRRARNSAWWVVGEDPGYYTENPFARPIQEQFEFRQAQQVITVDNFGEALSEQELADLRAALQQLDTITNGLIFAVMPTIILQSDFAEQYFAILGTTEIPRGLAHASRGLVSLDRKSYEQGTTDRSPDGRMSQAMAIMYHEAAHMLDHYIKEFLTRFGEEQLPASFYIFFDYESQVDNPRQRITPRRAVDVVNLRGEHESKAQWQEYSDDQHAASAPYRDYGYTNSKEDLATAMEGLLSGADGLDPLRRDALIQILQFVSAAATIKRRPGAVVSRMALDQIIEATDEALAEGVEDAQPLVATPVAYEEDEGGVKVASAERPLEVTRKIGDEIVYPALNDAELRRPTKVLIRIDKRLGSGKKSP